jgi:hypothetical protein
LYESDFDLKQYREIPAEVQNIAHQATLDHNQERLQQMQDLTDQVRQLGAEYRKELYAIIGSENLERYREFRSRSKNRLVIESPAEDERDAQLRNKRQQAVTEGNEFLIATGIDPNRLTKLQEQHSERVRLFLEANQLPKSDHAVSLDPPPYDGGNSSWDIYTPPYAGSFWSFQWDRSDEPDDPTLTRHLDQNNGRIGSSINTRLAGADDDDFLRADYYTALKLWHQAPTMGQIEVYFALRFIESTFSGSIDDEFGFSDYVLFQWAQPQARILAPDDSWDTQFRGMFNIATRDPAVRGFTLISPPLPTITFEDSKRRWENEVFPPNEVHWYYFKTDQVFSAGSWLLLEAAIQNFIIFTSNDTSITTFNNVDLRLDRVAVRTIQ